MLVAVAIIAAVTFRDYGLGWDDYTHSEYGDLLLAFYGSGFSDQRALSFVNLYKYGGGFDMAAALAAKVLPFGLFETRRLLGAAVGVVGTRGRANLLGIFALFDDDPGRINTILGEIEKVTVEDVKAAAGRWLVPANRTSIDSRPAPKPSQGGAR